MAALLDSFELAKLPKDLNFVGSRQGNDTETVLITCMECVYMYHVTDQKLLQSWPVTSHGNQITCPAVWSPNNNGVVYAENKQIVHIIKPNKTKRITIKDPIYEVFTAGKYEIVLCDNGCVHFTSDHADSSQSKAGPGEKIIFADCLKIGDGFCILVILQEEDTAGGRVLCHWRRESGGGWNSSSTQISLSTSQSFSCSAQSDSLKLFSLEGSGRLTSMRLTPSGGSTTDLGQVEGYAVTCISGTQLALAGWQKGGQVGVGIFNVDFGMLQTWQPFPASIGNHKPKVYCMERHLVLMSGRQVFALPYHCTSSLLISGISRTDLASPDSASHQVTDAEKTYDALDTSKTSTVGKFRMAFDKLLKDLKQADFHPGQHDILRSRLLQRCLTEKRFSTCNQISKLMEAKFIMRQDILPIAECFMKHKEVLLLSQLVKQEPMMPEEFLIGCLSFYLGLGDEELAGACKGALVLENGREEDMETETEAAAATEDANPFSPIRTHLVNEILSRKVEEDLLRHHLKKLDFQLAMEMLKYLKYLWTPDFFSLQLMTNICQVIGVASQERKGTEISQENVVIWLKCIVDAHFNQLMLAPDARALYQSLYQRSLQVMNDADKACRTESKMLNHISTKKLTKVSKKYSIEVLEL